MFSLVNFRTVFFNFPSMMGRYIIIGENHEGLASAAEEK